MDTEFLTPGERAIIQRFLRNGTPDESVLELRRRKTEELERYLDAQVPNTPVTWRTLIQDNEIACPLERFLDIFTDLIEDRELRHKISQGKRYPVLRDPRLSLLEDLDHALSTHRYPCKSCPGKLVGQRPQAP